MAAMYNMEADKLKELLGENEKAAMKEDMLKKKALDSLAKCAKE